MVLDQGLERRQIIFGLPAEEWSESLAFGMAVANVEAVNIVNDGAEMGVKLATEFLGSARGEHHLQNVVQTVETARQCHSDLRRNKHQ